MDVLCVGDDTFDATAAGRLTGVGERSVAGVVCDRRLPKTDGVEFLRAVRDDHGDLPFVLRVDREAEEAVDDALDAGVTDCVRESPETIRYDSLAKRSETASRATAPNDAVTVTLGSLPGGFYVEDEGPGLSDGHDVFEAGYSTETGGTGLGLAIVERIAAEHGWSVDATDGSDGGARFEFRR